MFNRDSERWLTTYPWCETLLVSDFMSDEEDAEDEEGFHFAVVQPSIRSAMIFEQMKEKFHIQEESNFFDFRLPI